MKALAVTIAFSILFTSSVSASRYWPPKLVTWSLSLNNGVAYISSPEIPSHCSYSRAQINMDGTEFNKALYAYALSAKAKSKELKYVIDSEQSICVVTGLSETT